MTDVTALEQLLREELADIAPDQLFKSTLKQKLLDHTSFRRKRVIYQWLAYALAGVVAGVAVYGVAAMISKNDGKLLCCGSGDVSQGGS